MVHFDKLEIGKPQLSEKMNFIVDVYSSPHPSLLHTPPSSQM